MASNMELIDALNEAMMTIGYIADKEDKPGLSNILNIVNAGLEAIQKELINRERVNGMGN